MFNLALVILSIASSFVLIYLIAQDPDFLADSPLLDSSCRGAPSNALSEHACPTNESEAICSRRGTCQAGVCSCEEGWVGYDCSTPACPGSCNGHGSCYQGYCVCDNGWAGIDCSIDRLHVSASVMMDDVDFESFSKSSDCHFLARELFDKSEGGEAKFQYESAGSSQMETFRFPQDKLRALPQKCPDYSFKTCAFVGNSGTMKFSNYGSEIDGHDMVYRFNQAPTLGYEAQVGSETTFESLNAKHAHNLLRQDTKWNWRDPVPIYLLFEPLKLKETLIDVHAKFPQVQILVLSPAFFRKAHEIYDSLQSELEKHEFGCFSGEKPMSGFYSLLIATTMCDRIDMYGFEPWEDWMAEGQSELHYHYFDREEPRPGAHSFDATFFMYKLVELSGQANLTIRTIPLPKEVVRLGRNRKRTTDSILRQQKDPEE